MASSTAPCACSISPRTSSVWLHDCSWDLLCAIGHRKVQIGEYGGRGADDTGGMRGEFYRVEDCYEIRICLYRYAYTSSSV